MSKKDVRLITLAVGCGKPIVLSDAFQEMLKEHKDNPFPALEEMNEKYVCDWKLGVELAEKIELEKIKKYNK